MNPPDPKHIVYSGEFMLLKANKIYLILYHLLFVHMYCIIMCTHFPYL